MPNLFDATNAPTREPLSFVVGSFVQWKRPDLSDDYDPTLYNLIYTARIRGGSSTEIIITANEVGGEFVVQIPSATSAGYTAGHYYWQAEIERQSDSERVAVAAGDWTIVEDLDTNNADPRTHAEIMLDKVEGLLEGRADKDVSSYSIAGRSITKMAVTELLEWRDYYRAEVAKERRESAIRNGRPNNAQVKVRFL